MGHISTEEVTKHKYNLYYVGATKSLIGQAKQDTDGAFYYWPEANLSGNWDSQTLRQIAETLQSLNEE